MCCKQELLLSLTRFVNYLPYSDLAGPLWASPRENLSVECEQKRRRPAYASAQSDQRLCYSISGKYNSLTCYRLTFNILASPCSRAGWVESYFVGRPKTVFLNKSPIYHVQ